METSVLSDNKKEKKYKTLGPYPVRTLVVIALLSGFVALILWFRFVYKPGSAVPSPTPRVVLDRPKINTPLLPSDIISPLKVNGFSFSLPQGTTLPDSAYLISATNSGVFESTAQAIAQKLGLNRTSTTSEKITWSTPNATLIAYKQDRHISYFTTNNDQSKPSPDPNTAQATIQLFFTNLGLWQQDYSSVTDQIKGFTISGYNLVPSTSAKPDVIEVPFHLLINQSPVIVGQEEYPLTVRLGHDQQIVAFTLYPTNFSTQAITNYSLVPLSQISSLLSQNKARLIEASPLGYGPSPASNNITQAAITSIQPALFYSFSQNLLYPAYLLKGNSSFSDASQATTTFLLPALDPSYYQ